MATTMGGRVPSRRASRSAHGEAHYVPLARALLVSGLVDRARDRPVLAARQPRLDREAPLRAALGGDEHRSAAALARAGQLRLAREEPAPPLADDLPDRHVHALHPAAVTRGARGFRGAAPIAGGALEADAALAVLEAAALHLRGRPLLVEAARPATRARWRASGRLRVQDPRGVDLLVLRVLGVVR